MKNSLSRLGLAGLVGTIAVLGATTLSAGDQRSKGAARAGEVAKTPLTTLKVRDTMSVALTNHGRVETDIEVAVEFFDERGQRLALERGRLARGKASFVARLSHDQLGAYDDVLVRAVVSTATVDPVDSSASCPIGGSVNNQNGPVLTWTSNPCDCGVTTGGHVFLACPPGGVPQILQGGN